MIMRQAQLVEYACTQDSAFAYGGPSGPSGGGEAAKEEADGEKGNKKKGKKGGGRDSDMRAGLLQEAVVFAGSHRDAGEYMIAPSLLDYVAKEIERDASVMKQVRKAREERRLLHRS